MPSEDHDTPVTFSRDEATQVRRRAANPDEPLVCPRCGAALTIGNPVAGGTIYHAWEVRCEACRRSVFVTDVAKDRRPEPGA